MVKLQDLTHTTESAGCVLPRRLGIRWGCTRVSRHMLLHDVFVPTTRAAAACSGRCTTPSPSLPELPGDLPRAHASGLGGALAYLTAVCGDTHPAHRDSGKG